MEYYAVIKDYVDLDVLIWENIRGVLFGGNEWVIKVACVVWATLGLKKKYLNIYA